MSQSFCTMGILVLAPFHILTNMFLRFTEIFHRRPSQILFWKLHVLKLYGLYVSVVDRVVLMWSVTAIFRAGYENYVLRIPIRPEKIPGVYLSVCPGKFQKHRYVHEHVFVLSKENTPRPLG